MLVGSRGESVPSTLYGDLFRQHRSPRHRTTPLRPRRMPPYCIPPGRASQHSTTHRQLASKQCDRSSGEPRRPRTVPRNGATRSRSPELRNSEQSRSGGPYHAMTPVTVVKMGPAGTILKFEPDLAVCACDAKTSIVQETRSHTIQLQSDHLFSSGKRKRTVGPLGVAIQASVVAIRRAVLTVANLRG